MTSYLGDTQREILAMLIDDGRERSATQLVGSRYAGTARTSLRRLARRGLVVERQGWAGWMFTINDAGRRALEWYR